MNFLQPKKIAVRGWSEDDVEDQIEMFYRDNGWFDYTVGDIKNTRYHFKPWVAIIERIH